jgi:hypothetical protein
MEGLRKIVRAAGVVILRIIGGAVLYNATEMVEVMLGIFLS